MDDQRIAAAWDAFRSSVESAAGMKRGELVNFLGSVESHRKHFEQAIRTALREQGEDKDAERALVAVKECLVRANEAEPSPICDTIWFSPTETLFDYIDAAIRQKGKESDNG